MNESVMHREAEDEIIALFYYLFLLDCLHYYFSLYICSIERYYMENMLSFTLNIMLTDSLLLTNTTNRMLTILIANLLTLGIIRIVDIFTGIGMGLSLEEGQGSNPAIGFEGSSIPGVNRPILDNKI